MAGEVIICLVGKSGSGKTTIAKELEDRFNIVKSYTTRPPRYKDEWGHTFVDKNYRIPYHNTIGFTTFNGYKYWATKDQFKNKGISIYIVDYAGVIYLRNKLQDAKIVVVYLQCGWFKRLCRLLKRDKLKAIGRLIHDRKAFNNILFDYEIDTSGNKYDSALQIESLITRKFWGF